MIYKQFNIWDEFDGDMRTGATLTVYALENFPEINMKRRHKSVLICPGGGYQGVSDREAEAVALEFAAAGFCAFVLRYSVAPNRYPTQLLEVSRAMWLIRENAEEWNVDADNIAVCGFSAGGHLVSHLATCWHQAFIAETLGMPQGMNKPNKLILCYAVSSAVNECTHKGSFENLLGEGKEAEYASVSPELLVSDKTPPTFIWHTFDDDVVPVELALSFAMSLKKNNIPCEMHIYPSGVHGLSLGDSRTSDTDEFVNTYITRWMENCIIWLNNN